MSKALREAVCAAVLGALLVGCGGSEPAGETGAGSGGGGAAGVQPGALAGFGGGGLQSGSGAANGGAGGAGRAGGGASGAGGASGNAGSAGTGGQAPDAGPPTEAGTPHVYVSGYGPSITHFTLDLASGALTRQDAVPAGTAPSYLAIASSKRALYAVDESGSGGGSRVIAFAIDADSGALTEINSATSGGEGAPHLAVHPSGDYVAVAHYGSGHTTILPVGVDYGVSAPIASERGPSDGCGKAHQVVFDASGRHLLVPCLESDYVLQLGFDAGTLSYASPATAAVSDGPRHVALAPDEQHAYVLSELDSTITSFAYDASTGTLSEPETIDSQQATKGASAHLVVHPSGRFLYASNRGENSLGLFAIDAGGRLAAVAFERDGIDTPRDFTVDPTGTYLILANQGGAGDLRVYRIAPEDGRLTYAQSVAVGGSPTFVGVVLLP